MISGVYWNQHVCLSVCPSVCLSVYPSVYKILLPVKALADVLKSRIGTALISTTYARIENKKSVSNYLLRIPPQNATKIGHVTMLNRKIN